jgi:hypothetical protein
MIIGDMGPIEDSLARLDAWVGFSRHSIKFFSEFL